MFVFKILSFVAVLALLLAISTAQEQGNQPEDAQAPQEENAPAANEAKSPVKSRTLMTTGVRRLDRSEIGNKSPSFLCRCRTTK